MQLGLRQQEQRVRLELLLQVQLGLQRQEQQLPNQLQQQVRFQQRELLLVVRGCWRLARSP